MADAPRARRMSGRIKQIVATVIERQIKDPRLGMVTITDVRVTGDLHDATLFYTVLGGQEERDASAAALESAKGVLRSEVGRQTGVRYTPSLTFVLDALPDSARQLEDLLARTAAEDARLAAIREGAQPAGEADPYRKPRVIEDDDDLHDDDDPADDDLDDNDDPTADDLDVDGDDAPRSSDQPTD